MDGNPRGLRPRRRAGRGRAARVEGRGRARRPQSAGGGERAGVPDEAVATGVPPARGADADFLLRGLDVENSGHLLERLLAPLLQPASESPSPTQLLSAGAEQIELLGDKVLPALR